eukprot:363925-Chlamydomonas_euryale.AAC.16
MSACMHGSTYGSDMLRTHAPVTILAPTFSLVFFPNAPAIDVMSRRPDAAPSCDARTSRGRLELPPTSSDAYKAALLRSRPPSSARPHCLRPGSRPPAPHLLPAPSASAPSPSSCR